MSTWAGWSGRIGGASRASFPQAGESTVVLTEDSALVLGRLSPDRFMGRGRADVVGATVWTVPTLVGTTLYLRDLAEILTFDSGGYVLTRSVCRDGLQ